MFVVHFWPPITGSGYGSGSTALEFPQLIIDAIALPLEFKVFFWLFSEFRFSKSS
jgi:hypothetical protein